MERKVLLSVQGVSKFFGDNEVLKSLSLDVYEGCAKRTVALCKEAGVTLTGAGATFPYGKDPEDKNIRIAPTFPSRDELCKAVEILCLCVEISAIEKILG